MRRLCVAILALLLLLSACGGSAQTFASQRVSKAFTWQRVSSDVQVRADGSLGVNETLTLAYTGGPFTFAFRDLPERRLDGISNITVSDGERAFQLVSDDESEQLYTFSVSKEGNAQRVRWVYPEATGGTRTFVLRYDVAGAVRRYADADELWWSVAFPNRDELIEQASGQIRLPVAVPVAQLDASAPDVAGTIDRAPGMASIAGTNIPANSELTLRLRFPKNVVAGAAPAWQARDAAQEAYNITTRPIVNVALSALAGVLALLFGTLLAFWWRRNRDPQPNGFASGELPTAPEDLTPAAAGRLLGQDTGAGLIGTILDLANRGYLTLREEKGGWRNSRTDMRLLRTERPADDLTAGEQSTLQALDLSARNSQAVLRDQAKQVQKSLPMFYDTAQSELIERGYLHAAGLAQRKQGIVIGTILLAAGVLLFIPAGLLAERYSAWLPVLTGVITLAGGVWLLLGLLMRGVTQAGADALVRWKGFRSYLKRVKPERAPVGQFPTLLPYAVAFADPAKLTKAYSHGNEPLPIWYYPIMTNRSNYTPSSSSGTATVGVARSGLLLHDFSQNIITALRSAGSSVGATSSGGGSAGGGASGGGGGGAG